jgi:queuine/archaeosine tRNA-ribosyltransferase
MNELSMMVLQLEVAGFMALQEALAADVYEVMADDDTPPDASNKRLQKSFDRSMHFLDACLKHHGKSEVRKIRYF